MTRLLEADYQPLMLAQVEALRRYVDQHGRCWKASLRNEWMCASAEPLLHSLRNSHGPRRLANFQFEATISEPVRAAAD
jgi:hypothetical protein